MTRINSGILPAELPTKVLIAELYEIQRLTKIVHKRSLKTKIPLNFKLGTGHVVFFYDKGLYTLNRYKALYNEAIKRGCDVQNFESRWNDYPKELFNDWVEENCREIILERFKKKGHKLLKL